MGSIVSCISNFMYIFEKISLFATCTGLICCLVMTITLTLGMGIGLGYNYCFVDSETKHRYLRSQRSYDKYDYREYRYRDRWGRDGWPYKKREAAMEDPLYDDVTEEDALRKGREPSNITSSSSVSSSDDDTKSSEDSSETNSTSTTLTKSSTITEAETMNIKNTETTPKPTIVKEEKPNNRKVKKLVIPISGMDLISLLSKLKAENRNYSLQVVTT